MSKVEKLEEQRDALNAKIARVRAKEQHETRKADTRFKILRGTIAMMHDRDLIENQCYSCGEVYQVLGHDAEDHLNERDLDFFYKYLNEHLERYLKIK